MCMSLQKVIVNYIAERLQPSLDFRLSLLMCFLKLEMFEFVFDLQFTVWLSTLMTSIILDVTQPQREKLTCKLQIFLLPANLFTK